MLNLIFENVRSGLFGSDILPKKISNDEKDVVANEKHISFAKPTANEGEEIFVSPEGFAHQSAYMDFGTDLFSDVARILKYREIAMNPEVDQAIEDIISEAIISDEEISPVRILFDDIGNDNSEEEERKIISEKVQKSIAQEFERILKIMKFSTEAHDIFRKWYIDGRIVYHIIVDEAKKEIIEIRDIDPVKIKKVKEIEERIDPETGVKVYANKEEFFVYSETVGENTKIKTWRNRTSGLPFTKEVKISTKAIVYCSSGLLDEQRKNVISFLHKAIKPANQLRMLEDSLIIYRLARAPERRVFYVDVGGLPTKRAQQYLESVIAKFRNKITYDATTGETASATNQMAMVEDFWLPRSSVAGRSGTEISTLPGGQGLSSLEDLDHFKKKLYRSLNVPLGRLEQESQFSLGRSSEITRDEVKFAKFVSRLRKRFSSLFYQLLKTQVLMKNIVSPEEWEKVKDNIRFDFIKDNHFSEMKEAEVLRERMITLREIADYEGKYYSREWIRRNVLKQTDSEYELISKQIEEEEVLYKDEDELDPTLGI